jgi:hypothetical protein
MKLTRTEWLPDSTRRAAFGREVFCVPALACIAMLAALAATLTPWLAAPAAAQDVIYSAERVKAAFLYHFSTYVDWPETGNANEAFTIAVLGADSVAAELERFLPGHTIHGRPMEARRLGSIDELGNDEVLYIGAEENQRLPDHLARVGSRPMLVVTDVPGGLREGAMINFRIVDDRVRFEISQHAAQLAGLELSSRLLSAAMSVDTAGAIIEVPATVVRNERRRASD